MVEKQAPTQPTSTQQAVAEATATQGKETPPEDLVADPGEPDIFSATDEELEAHDEKTLAETLAKFPALEAITTQESNEEPTSAPQHEEEDKEAVETPQASETPPEELEEPELDLSEAFQEQLNNLSQEAMAHKLQQLTTQTTQTPQPGAVAGAPPGQPPPEPPPAPLQSPALVTPQDFVSAEEWEAAQQSHTALNGVLSRLAAQTQQAAVQQTLKQLPDIQGMINQSIQAYALENAFFDKNKDLQGVRSFVQLQAHELVAQHADWTLNDLFRELAPHTRGVLKKLQERQQAKAAAPRTPAVETPRAAATRPSTKSKSQLERDYDDIVITQG